MHASRHYQPPGIKAGNQNAASEDTACMEIGCCQAVMPMEYQNSELVVLALLVSDHRLQILCLFHPASNIL